MPGLDNAVEWRIINKVQEAPHTFTYTFFMDTKLDFTLGQFVTLGTSLNRPTMSGDLEESYVERAYSIASSPKRNNVDITIKCEKPYGYINPKLKKADGFAAYFFEQIKIGDKVKVKIGTKKDHFLARIASGDEKSIAYWSGANGAESARGLIQYMEDNPDQGIKLSLFYSNPHLYSDDTTRTVDVIYYDWLMEKAKKMETLKVIFAFTRDKEVPNSDHPRIIFRNRRFFLDSQGGKEKTLSIHHNNPKSSFNPICGSSGFITGVVMGPDGKLVKRRGIMQDLMDVEGISPDRIDKEQFYLDQHH